MAKPLGYWGCNYDYQLITDIMETWKDNLQELSETDQVWLIGKLGDYYWTVGLDSDDEPSEEAEEIVNRLYELPKNQVGCLIQAVTNKSMCKPLTYWGCNHELQLIEDIAETFGWNLEELSEPDYYWLIARLGSYYWRIHCDNSPSEEAQEVIERVAEHEQLPANQVSALIVALANK